MPFDIKPTYQELGARLKMFRRTAQSIPTNAIKGYLRLAHTQADQGAINPSNLGLNAALLLGYKPAVYLTIDPVCPEVTEEHLAFFRQWGLGLTDLGDGRLFIWQPDSLAELYGCSLGEIESFMLRLALGSPNNWGYPLGYANNCWQTNTYGVGVIITDQLEPLTRKQILSLHGSGAQNEAEATLLALYYAEAGEAVIKILTPMDYRYVIYQVDRNRRHLPSRLFSQGSLYPDGQKIPWE